MNIDKRNHKRLKTRDLTIIYKVEGQDVVYKADVINISSGGICFLRSAYLEVGDVMHIKFPFKSRKVILTAKVIRMDGREAGIKFLDTDDHIERFIKVFNEEYPHLKREDFRKKEDYYKKSLKPYEEEEEDEADEFDDRMEIDKIDE
ncbi:MAG: PilZ domain-containing protein [Spirochaetes bacterium]|jgi:hypothetical protein|nr:PilZ domain-containing protein [Spirochaetota bacterium]